MIYPSVRAVLLAALGAPLALLVGGLAPGLWLIALAWIVLVAGLCLADAGLGADRRRLEVEVRHPAVLPVGGAGEAQVTVRFKRGAAPSRLQLALEANERLSVAPDQIAVAMEGRAGAAPRLKRTVTCASPAPPTGSTAGWRTSTSSRRRSAPKPASARQSPATSTIQASAISHRPGARPPTSNANGAPRAASSTARTLG